MLSPFRLRLAVVSIFVACTVIAAFQFGAITLAEVGSFLDEAQNNVLPGSFTVNTAGGTPTPTPSPSPTCVPPPPGMVNWWPGDGNANDIQGGANGTLVNGTTFAAGKVGQAFSFDGSDDRVDAPAGVGDFGSNPFTVDFWMYSNSVGTNTFILGKNNANGGIGWDIRLNSNTIQIVGVNGWGFNITSDGGEGWKTLAEMPEPSP